MVLGDLDGCIMFCLLALRLFDPGSEFARGQVFHGGALVFFADPLWGLRRAAAPLNAVAHGTRVLVGVSDRLWLPEWIFFRFTSAVHADTELFVEN
jgi:hypothetical protein